MNALHLDTILRPTSDEAGFDDTMRVLVPPSDGWVWMIAVNFEKARPYASGPIRFRSDIVDEWLTRGLIEVSEFVIPPHWLMSDEELNQKYSGDASTDCAMVLRQKRAWNAIEPYVTENSVDMAIQTQNIHHWITQRQAELIDLGNKYGGKCVRCSKTWLYDCVHCFWASGCNQYALRGNRLHCGAPDGVHQQHTIKLGRPDAAVRGTVGPLERLPLSQQDIANLQVGWENFRYGRTVGAAYLETMAVFYRAGIEVKNGIPQPILTRAESRPTLRQFEYWGKKFDSQHYRRRWEESAGRRPMPGMANEDVIRVGQRGWLDSSSGDVHLVSVLSRVVPVGPANCFEVMDAKSTAICGLHCDFDPPSARLALLTLAHAAMPKGEWCARYGFPDVTDKQFPAVPFAETFTDNGELRNALSERIYVRGWHGSIEYAPAGRGEAKGPIEGDHHVRHSQVDHQCPGTTHGRQTQYGEQPPAALAALNYFEYVRQHIRRVLFYNTQEPVPHLLTAEMRNDLDANASRMDIFNWLVDHGYKTELPVSADMIRAHMLPSYDATMTGRGVFLHRRDTGEKIEFIPGCRFVSDYLIESGMLAKAARDHKRVTVTMDAPCINVAWIATKDGLQRLENVDPDQFTLKRATVHDLQVIRNFDMVALLHGRTPREQAKVEFINARDTENDAAVNAKKQEIRKGGNTKKKSTTNTSSRQSINKNRAAERRLLSENGDPPHPPTTADNADQSTSGSSGQQHIPARNPGRATNPQPRTIRPVVLASLRKFMKEIKK
ncbi:hypothetical protein PQQ86_24980 [Paraburkholderia sediminicola]|uniref:hypothetical protein n=1 Tax=Paraburkholderia sediminicola TaxID=458836 RepID=UPI0038B94CAB